MKSALRVLLLGMAAGFCSQAQAGQLFPNPPADWTVTVEVNGNFKIVCRKDGQTSIVSRSLYPKDPRYTVLLYAGVLTPEQTKMVFDSAVDVFQNFKFPDKPSGVMDGASVALTLESWDQKLTADIYTVDNAPEGVRRILDLAEKLDLIKWVWTKEIPARIASNGPARNRTVKAIHGLFKTGSKQVTVKAALQLLGNPDAYSPHFGVSMELCATAADDRGGTMRFALADGSEALLWTPDFKTIDYAIRFGPGKDDEDILFMMPRR